LRELSGCSTRPSTAAQMTTLRARPGMATYGLEGLDHQGCVLRGGKWQKGHAPGCGLVVI
jgi:hypothetical protein